MPYRKSISYKKLVAEHGKRCSACGKKKLAYEFNKNRRRSDGLQAYCRACWKTRYSKCSAAYERSEKGKQRKAAWLVAHPDARARWGKSYKENKRLRAAIAEGDKLYQYDIPIQGSALGRA